MLNAFEPAGSIFSCQNKTLQIESEKSVFLAFAADRELLAALCPAAGENHASASRCHSRAESEFPISLDLTRLICTQHKNYVSLI
jgi:hypothetical protein